MDAKEKGDQGEDAVNEIAFGTYLKYWCYPNPKDELGDKKEICDLLIHFKSTLIIFSVKNYSFDGNYSRYFNNTLKKAVSQIQGAERKLLNGTRLISIKHPDKEIEEIDPKSIHEIQRVVVNLNTTPLFYPGGKLTKKGEYAHILNWDSFLRLVIELDTIPDFIEYLKVREQSFRNRELLIMTGEESDYDSNTGIQLFKHNDPIDPTKKSKIMLSGSELDLLADYYFNDRKFNSHITSNQFNGMSYEMDGKWEDYLQRDEVVNKKKDDKYSYFVDEFVKREVLYQTSKQNLELAAELLSMSRFERRILGKQFFDFINKYKDKSDRFIARRYGKYGDTVICLMLYGSAFTREEALLPLVIAGRGFSHWENYKTKKMVMIGFDNRGSGFLFGYDNNVKPLPPDEHQQLLEDIELLNWFKKMNQSTFTIKEYPDK